jgi:hypothetical protein
MSMFVFVVRGASSWCLEVIDNSVTTTHRNSSTVEILFQPKKNSIILSIFFLQKNHESFQILKIHKIF